MELRVLRYFIEVAREKNITRAAELLHVTQPTLSRQLMELEQELGATLFIRGSREITLTEDGIFFRQRAEEIVELANRTEREFTQRGERVTGVVSLGCTETMGMRKLADLIEQFGASYPDVQFDIYNGFTDDIKERIDKGVIDIGLLTMPVDISKYEFVRLHQKEAWGAFIPNSYPESKLDKITYKQLSSLPLLIPKRAAVQNEILNLFGDDAKKLKIIATFSLLSNAVLLVERGMGCAVCMDGALAIRGSTQATFVPFSPEHITESVLVWKKEHLFNTASSIFIQMANILRKTEN